MKLNDLKDLGDDKYILIDGGGEVFGVELDHVSDVAIWLKVVMDD